MKKIILLVLMFSAFQANASVNIVKVDYNSNGYDRGPYNQDINVSNNGTDFDPIDEGNSQAVDNADDDIHDFDNRDFDDNANIHTGGGRR